MRAKILHEIFNLKHIHNDRIVLKVNVAKRIV